MNEPSILLSQSNDCLHVLYLFSSGYPVWNFSRLQAALVVFKSETLSLGPKCTSLGFSCCAKQSSWNKLIRINFLAVIKLKLHLLKLSTRNPWVIFYRPRNNGDNFPVEYFGREFFNEMINSNFIDCSLLTSSRLLYFHVNFRFTCLKNVAVSYLKNWAKLNDNPEHVILYYCVFIFSQYVPSHSSFVTNCP